MKLIAFVLATLVCCTLTATINRVTRCPEGTRIECPPVADDCVETEIQFPNGPFCPACLGCAQAATVSVVELQ
ncbi:hypothetical protein EB796_019318 [Bugula neritina]|uniref:Uncharacterized protein n=1 Tax=Bugula neritina TaxID=10212 RepID=A0A7J7JAI7_BUGNE|nr:hypothetical protein EB796_019318 [Bugula neritina]